MQEDEVLMDSHARSPTSRKRQPTNPINPPQQVNNNTHPHPTSNPRKAKHIHISIHPRNPRIRHTIGQRRQPSLGFPLRRVGPPDLGAGVDGVDADHEGRVLGDEELGDGVAVVSFEGCG